jgi:hypothetical protein
MSKNTNKNDSEYADDVCHVNEDEDDGDICYVDDVCYVSDMIEVKRVVPLALDYELSILFSTGEWKKFDVKPLLSKKIFSPLKNKQLFDKAHVEDGTVVWTDEIDLCPEMLYRNSIKQ